VDIGEDLQAYILRATFKGGDVVGSCDKWGVEDIARGEELVHPGPTWEGGHDMGDIELAFVVSSKLSLLSLTDVLSV